MFVGRTVSETGRVSSAVVDIFWRRTSGFLALLISMQLVTFDAPAGFATEVGRMANRLAVKILADWLGVLVFFPLDDAMT